MYRVFALLGLSLATAVVSPALAAAVGSLDPVIADMRPSLPPAQAGAELAMTLPPAADIAEAIGAGPPTRQALGPKVMVRVDLSEQSMTVLVRGKVAHVWKVSTAGRGYHTPTGFWTPYRMHVMWRSRKYDNAPMPHSIFFHEGYAIHATPYVKRLGKPASHGCVRLHPDNAKALFALVRQYGPAAVRVSIEN
jgi:lipoprotein-anchoring transpeptidase ErfK/SrfK